MELLIPNGTRRVQIYKRNQRMVVEVEYENALSAVNIEGFGN